MKIRTRANDGVLNDAQPGQTSFRVGQTVYILRNQHRGRRSVHTAVVLGLHPGEVDLHVNTPNGKKRESLAYKKVYAVRPSPTGVEPAPTGLLRAPPIAFANLASQAAAHSELVEAPSSDGGAYSTDEMRVTDRVAVRNRRGRQRTRAGTIRSFTAAGVVVDIDASDKAPASTMTVHRSQITFFQHAVEEASAGENSGADEIAPESAVESESTTTTTTGTPAAIEPTTITATSMPDGEVLAWIAMASTLPAGLRARANKLREEAALLDAEAERLVDRADEKKAEADAAEREAITVEEIHAYARERAGHIRLD